MSIEIQCEACGRKVVVSPSTAFRPGRTKPQRFCSIQCGAKGNRARGEKAPGWKGGRFVSHGYVMIFKPDHPHARSGYVQEHRLVAEAALGKLLRRNAPVHHHNEEHSDNRNSNLVICEDQGYHMLLHVRARILRAGGNPATDLLCNGCDTVKSRSLFYVNRAKESGHSHKCINCDRSDRSERERRSA